MNGMVNYLKARKVSLFIADTETAYTSVEVVRRLVCVGAKVTAFVAKRAEPYVSSLKLERFCDQPVVSVELDELPVLDCARLPTDCLVILGASVDVLNSIEAAFHRELSSNDLRASRLVVFPAMDSNVWATTAVQSLVNRCRAFGMLVVDLCDSDVLPGETGFFRAVSPESVQEEVEGFFVPKLLGGKKLVITAGPTFEAIDPVRGITNLSSGKMGFAIARAARNAGADTLLIAGPNCPPTPRGVKRIDVTSAAQMCDCVIGNLDGADVFVSVAAVADWRPETVVPYKLKKVDSHSVPDIRFVQNPDILATVAARNDPPFCVGFAAEEDELEYNGDQKRRRKGVPLLIGNIGSLTFGTDEAEVVLFDDTGSLRLPKGSKSALASQIIEFIAKRIP